MFCFQSKCWQTSLKEYHLYFVTSHSKPYIVLIYRLWKHPHILLYTPHWLPFNFPLASKKFCHFHSCTNDTPTTDIYGAVFSCVLDVVKLPPSFQPWPHTVPVFWLFTCWQWQTQDDFLVPSCLHSALTYHISTEFQLMMSLGALQVHF